MADWSEDLREVVARAPTSIESIREYMRQKYPNESEADRRAWLLDTALRFVSRHRSELDDAGVLVTGTTSDMGSPFLGIALYRWLALMPWPGQVPFPTLDTIVNLANEEKSKANPDKR